MIFEPVFAWCIGFLMGRAGGPSKKWAAEALERTRQAETHFRRMAVIYEKMGRAEDFAAVCDELREGWEVAHEDMRQLAEVYERAMR